MFTKPLQTAVLAGIGMLIAGTTLHADGPPALPGQPPSVSPTYRAPGAYAPPPPTDRYVAPAIDGGWRTNRGVTIVIARSGGTGYGFVDPTTRRPVVLMFDFRLANVVRSMVWPGVPAASGSVTKVDAQGRATQIRWDNGLVMDRVKPVQRANRGANSILGTSATMSRAAPPFTAPPRNNCVPPNGR